MKNTDTVQKKDKGIVQKLKNHDSLTVEELCYAAYRHGSHATLLRLIIMIEAGVCIEILRSKAQGAIDESKDIHCLVEGQKINVEGYGSITANTKPLA